MTKVTYIMLVHIYCLSVFASDKSMIQQDLTVNQKLTTKKDHQLVMQQNHGAQASKELPAKSSSIVPRAIELFSPWSQGESAPLLNQVSSSMENESLSRSKIVKDQLHDMQALILGFTSYLEKNKKEVSLERLTSSAVLNSSVENDVRDISVLESVHGQPERLTVLEEQDAGSPDALFLELGYLQRTNVQEDNDFEFSRSGSDIVETISYKK